MRRKSLPQESGDRAARDADRTWCSNLRSWGPRESSGIPRSTIAALQYIFRSASQLCIHHVAIGQHCLRHVEILRPAAQGRVPGFGQGVDAPLGAVEPAIDVTLQDLRRIWNIRAEVADSLRTA